MAHRLSSSKAKDADGQLGRHSRSANHSCRIIPDLIGSIAAFVCKRDADFHFAVRNCGKALKTCHLRIGSFRFENHLRASEAAKDAERDCRLRQIRSGSKSL